MHSLPLSHETPSSNLQFHVKYDLIILLPMHAPGVRSERAVMENLPAASEKAIFFVP
jgi:hypothetical protein